MKPPLFLLLLFLSSLFISSLADTSCSKALAGKIVDDAKLSSIILAARNRFLSTRPHPFTRCDITVLLPQGDGTFRRASYNQNELGYPASTVKLTYLVSALEWCKSNGMTYSCLDAHVRPMIYTSDNFETGVVVDYITGTHNYHPKTNNASDAQFLSWWKGRNFTQAYFDSRGLLEDQVIISKTYPTNSGSMPSGSEALLREVLGQNQMKPKCAASLMAEIFSGSLHPEAREYMLGMLQHARYSYSSIGMGTPPGSVLHNKIGNAYDTLEEIAYILLPNGQPLILAIYTNGYEPTEPDTNNLAYLAELIIDGLGFSGSSFPGNPSPLPKKYILSSPSASTSGSGWSTQSSRPDKYASSYLENSGSDPSAAAQWTFEPEESGIYEISVWNPENPSSSFSSSLTYTLTHAYGTDSFNINQHVNGGRWVKLGDFNLLQGKKALVNISSPSSSSKPFYLDSIKFNLWPTCNKIPGTACA